MKALDRNFVVAGKIGSTYGIKGWLKVHSYTEEPLQILKYKPWYLSQGSDWQVYELEDGRAHGKGIVVKLVGIENPEIARTLTGKNIAIKREQLVSLPAGEYYWADLEGLNVIDQKGQTLGQIIYMMATGSNDVIVIKDARGKEHAIPYLPGRVVKKVDLEQRIMFVDWDLI